MLSSGRSFLNNYGPTEGLNSANNCIFFGCFISEFALKWKLSQALGRFLGVFCLRVLLQCAIYSRRPLTIFDKSVYL
uniref:Uncharacterized protein n=1 Tax=Mesocestoides corti TaxID=53468 RepID=A0A5K3FGG5_MESCO